MNHNDALFRSLPQPWDRLLPHVATLMVWGVLFAVIYLLRSFFLLLFLTFVFSYIQARSVNRLETLIKNRVVRVALVALFLLGVLTATGVFLVPKVKTQTEVFVSQFGAYLGRVDQELFKLEKEYPLLGEILPEILSNDPGAADAVEKKGLKNSPSASLLLQCLGLRDAACGPLTLNQMLDTLGYIGG